MISSRTLFAVLNRARGTAGVATRSIHAASRGRQISQRPALLHKCGRGFAPPALTGLHSRVYATASDIAEEPPQQKFVRAPVDKDEDLEIKDPKLIFRTVIDKLEKKYGRENLRFPKEILWLAGAPAAGKGTNTALIQRERGFTARPIVVSELLNSPAMKELKDNGVLIGDKQVVELVLEQLLDAQYKESGVVVDGFPRTAVQAKCITQLHELMHHVRDEFFHTPVGFFFRRPLFRVIVLFIGEQESVDRQMKRGLEAKEKNEFMKATGVGGQEVELRATDFSVDYARSRYKTFKDMAYDSLMSLRNNFIFSLINAEGTFTEVEATIISEFQYQSNLELGAETNDSLALIPLASDVIRHARQKLVRRLDAYQNRESALFGRVLQVVKSEFVHIINRQALAGRAVIRSENAVFKNALAVDMALDVLSERGYHVILDSEKKEIPYALDPMSNTILTERKRIYHFNIEFPKPRIRRVEKYE